MRRTAWAWIACGAILLQAGPAKAQDSLKALEDELAQAKQQHDDVTTQSLTNFFSQVDSGMASSDAAVALYVQARSAQPNFIPPDTDQSGKSSLESTLLACGIPPSPVRSEHANETASEKDARLALDQANIAKLGIALQLHCGLMHYAALFVAKPDQKGLQDDWVAWLKTAAQIYPQLGMVQQTDDQAPQSRKKKKNHQPGANESAQPTPAPSYYPEDMLAKTMHDSIISKFLAFNLWADKEQGGWAVKDLPKLYRTKVLEPLRATPTAETLAAWDAYIAMANVDEPDNDKWNDVVYPPLQFDRACDDYTISPSTEKLEGLVNLIKANPTNPNADDWISRAHQLMDGYRTSHGGAPATTQTPAPSTTPSAPGSSPNVSITTVQQGDETIITTHTNSAPSTPAAPAH